MFCFIRIHFFAFSIFIIPLICLSNFLSFSPNILYQFISHLVLIEHGVFLPYISERVYVTARHLHCPVSWSWRVRLLYLCSMVRPLPLTSDPDITVNHPRLWLQCLRFMECGAPFNRYYSQVYHIYQPLRSGRIWHKINF